MAAACLQVAAHDHAPAKVRFIENKGQWEQPFLYRADVHGATAFLERDGITWVKLQENAADIMHDQAQLPLEQREQVMLNGHAWRMHFHGAEGSPQVSASDRDDTPLNFFLGDDPARWRSGVNGHGTILYQEVWPGIDVVVKGTERGNLKYDMLLAPGADPRLAVFRFEGVDGLSISEDGSLVLRTSVGDLQELAPVAYHADDRSPIDCAFKLENGLIHFELGTYDQGRAVVIDPELIASTYSGAVGPSNYGHCATYDDDGNIYTGARSFGPGYPTTLGAFQSNFGGGSVDISLSKLDPNGSELIWATYLGGMGSEYPHSLIVDHLGQLCVLGTTSSADYPTSANAYQPVFAGNTDMVVSVFSMDGTALIGSTYLGGANNDGNNSLSYANYGESYRGEIIVNDQNDILVASFTTSTDFPVTANAFQSAHGGAQDGVVLSLNSMCSDLLWSSFIGGSANDGAFGIRSIGGEVYVCGQTQSDDLTTTAGAYQTTAQGEDDGFVARISGDGSTLLTSTYFGTASDDRPYFLDNDTENNIWIYGQSLGDLPIQPADVYSQNNGSIFLAKLDPLLTTVSVSTKFATGNTYAFAPVAFLVDHCDKIYVSGYDAVWADVPVTENALEQSGSFYLAAFDIDMSDLVFATHYGGNHVDGGTSRFDKNGIVYQGVCASGNSMSTTAWAYAPTQQPAWDIGVFKIDFQVAGVTAAGASPVNEGCAPIEIQFSNTSTGTEWTWDFGDGSEPVSAFEPAHTYTQAGSYTVTLIASDSMACNLADTTTFEIEIGEAEPYEASFISEQDPACSSVEVSFSNTSTGSLMEFLWDMGDGTQYTDTNITHTYASPGTYEVQLNILDPTGCSQPDSVTQSITVVLDVATVEAVADIVPPEPCGDMTVHTTNNSTGTAPTYTWDMGDGTVLEEAEPVHVYAAPGTYTITFMASDPATCNMADTLTWEIEVEGLAVAELEFEADLQQECSAGTVQTTNGSTGGGLEYHWDMGDGNTYDSFEVMHVYEEPGYYMITLSATDPAGCADPMPYYVPVYVGEPLPVTAGFGVEMEHTCEGTLITATNFSGGENIAFTWSFGDGATSNEADVTHLYQEAGEVLLQLIVEDLDGCMPNDTMAQAIDVPPIPSPDASFDHTLLDNCEGGQFIGQTANDGPVEHIWYMGDGTQLEGTYIDHQYTMEGEYEVMLVTSDPGGCGSDTAYANVTVVMPVPMQLSFDLVEEYECGQTTVSCTNTSLGNDLTYIWWTSDDHSYYGPEMQHTFTEPGEYEIRFYGLDPMDCHDPDSVVVTITVDPVIPINADPQLIVNSDCDGTSVLASAGEASPSFQYEWDMGDGNSYGTPDAEHVFAGPGDHIVQLTITDGSGCNDPLVWTQEVEVEEPQFLDADFQMEVTEDCGTLEVVLINNSSGAPAEMIWDMGNGDQLAGEAVAYTYDAAGTYTITLTISDPESCNLTDTHANTVTVDPLPVVSASFDLQEEGDCGELEVICTNTGEGDNVTYLWSMGDGTTITSHNASHTYTGPGSYTIELIVTDLGGCSIADTATAQVEVPEPLPMAVDMAVSQVGDCGSMQVECTNLSGGMLFDWSWDMGDGTQYNTFNATHTYANPGTYAVSLIVTDTVCGMQEIQVTTVVVNDGVPQVELSSPVLCEGSTVTLDASATPGNYSWSTGSTGHSITVNEPGTYEVTVEGADGCTGTAEVVVPPGMEFVFEETVTACPNETVPLAIPMEGVAYTWSTGGIGSTEYVHGAGTYTFVVTDDDGCQHTGTYTVEAPEVEGQLFAPNAFTPDGDGVNDIFEIKGFGEEASHFAVYDRWGEMIFESRDARPTWDGFYNGDVVKQDVYVYQLEYRSTCSNEMVSTKGHVTVVK